MTTTAPVSAHESLHIEITNIFAEAQRKIDVAYKSFAASMFGANLVTAPVITTLNASAVVAIPAAGTAKAPAAKKARKPAAKKDKPAASAPASASGKKPGEKRSPAELQALQAKLLAFIKANPKCTAEQINKSLGTLTRVINGPMKKLLTAKSITSDGQKRGTNYTAA